MGTPEFAVPSLAQLYKSKHTIKAVVTGVDKRRGRGNSLSKTPIKAKAQEFGLPIIEVEDLKSSLFYEQLNKVEASLYVVVAFRILPPSILALPAKGSINLHASLLPKYRGAAPIHWAIINGEEETGCTIFMLDKNVDTGKIIAQSTTEIGQNETTGDLYNRLQKQGAELLLEAVNDIESGDHKVISQNHSEATPAPKLFSQDCKINFHQPAQKIHNFIRGLSPFPGAWAELDGLKFTIYRSHIGAESGLGAGQIAQRDSNMLVGCQSGTLALEEVKIEGKRKMAGRDFMNGYHGSGFIH